MMTQLITLKSLPWDLLLGFTWFVSCLVHVQLVLESLVLGCSSGQHEPRWFQGASLTSLLEAQSGPSSDHGPGLDHSINPDIATVACSPTSPQCIPMTAYPCDRALPMRFIFCISNFRELSAMVMQHPAWMQLMQLSPSGIFCMSAEACHLLLALLAYSLVQYRCWKPRQTEATTEASAPRQAGLDSHQAATAATAAPGGTATAAEVVPASIAVVPVALARWRTWLIACLHVSEPTALLLTLLLCPPSPEVLQFSWSYSFGSVAGNYFAAVEAMDCILATVSHTDELASMVNLLVPRCCDLHQQDTVVTTLPALHSV
jgi:hypothetical protein